MLKRFFMDDSGADATEYALLAALIAVAIIGGAQALGLSIDAVFTSLSGTIGDTVE